MESSFAIRIHQPDLNSGRLVRSPARESREAQDFQALMGQKVGSAPSDAPPTTEATGAFNMLQPILFQLPPEDIGVGEGIIPIPPGEIGPDGEPAGTGDRYAEPFPVDIPIGEAPPPAKDAVPPSPDGIPQDAPATEFIESEPPATVEAGTILELPLPGPGAPDILTVPEEFIAHAISTDPEALLESILTK